MAEKSKKSGKTNIPAKQRGFLLTKGRRRIKKRKTRFLAGRFYPGTPLHRCPTRDPLKSDYLSLHFAVTPSEEVRRHLVLYRGVRSMRVATEGGAEAQIGAVARAVLETGRLKVGDVVVIVMGSPVSAAGTTNLIKVQKL